MLGKTSPHSRHLVFKVFILTLTVLTLTINAFPTNHPSARHGRRHGKHKLSETLHDLSSLTSVPGDNNNAGEGTISGRNDSTAHTDGNEIAEMTNSKQYRHQLNRHPLLFDWTTSCGVCDPENCQIPPADCPSGLIRDACDCCYVCGNLEDTACDLPNEMFRFGQCGEGLVCSPVPPSDRGIGEGDAYCACASTTVICGSDGRTYSNPCRFKRASGRNIGLTRSHEGPCLAAPRVEIPPMNQTAESGSSAVFSCSVSGFPFAWFEWTKDGENIFQPGLSDGIAVQIRSGPLKYQVTTWLEILNVQAPHTGSYTCIAKNEYGEDTASARLEVIRGEYEDPSYYAYRGKRYRFPDRNHGISRGKSSTGSYATNYLRSHVIPDSEAPLALRESDHEVNILTLDGDVDLQSNEEYNQDRDEGNSNEEALDALFVETLENLVQPKEYKDIFFDDDDFSEGSGT